MRKLVHEARQVTWAGGLEVEPERLRWRVDTDVRRFGEASDAERWAEAARLYRGPFLEGFERAGSPKFQRWVALERDFLEHRWWRASLCHAEALERAGRHEDAALGASKLLDRDGLAEDVLQLYLRNVAAGGRQDLALALGVAERFRRELRREVGAEPLPSTLDLIKTIRRRVSPEPAGPKASGATFGRRSSDRLPRAERQELADILTLLQRPDTRLLTLTQPGTSGKEAFVIAKRSPDMTLVLLAIVELAERLGRRAPRAGRRTAAHDART